MSGILREIEYAPEPELEPGMLLELDENSQLSSTCDVKMEGLCYHGIPMRSCANCSMAAPSTLGPFRSGLGNGQFSEMSAATRMASKINKIHPDLLGACPPAEAQRRAAKILRELAPQPARGYEQPIRPSQIDESSDESSEEESEDIQPAAVIKSPAPPFIVPTYRQNQTPVRIPRQTPPQQRTPETYNAHTQMTPNTTIRSSQPVVTPVQQSAPTPMPPVVIKQEDLNDRSVFNVPQIIQVPVHIPVPVPTYTPMTLPPAPRKCGHAERVAKRQEEAKIDAKVDFQKDLIEQAKRERRLAEQAAQHAAAQREAAEAALQAACIHSNDMAHVLHAKQEEIMALAHRERHVNETAALQALSRQEFALSRVENDRAVVAAAAVSAQEDRKRAESAMQQAGNLVDVAMKLLTAANGLQNTQRHPPPVVPQLAPVLAQPEPPMPQPTVYPVADLKSPAPSTVSVGEQQPLKAEISNSGFSIDTESDGPSPPDGSDYQHTHHTIPSQRQPSDLNISAQASAESQLPIIPTDPSRSVFMSSVAPLAHVSGTVTPTNSSYNSIPPPYTTVECFRGLQPSEVIASVINGPPGVPSQSSISHQKIRSGLKMPVLKMPSAPGTTVGSDSCSYSVPPIEVDEPRSEDVLRHQIIVQEKSFISMSTSLPSQVEADFIPRDMESFRDESPPPIPAHITDSPPISPGAVNISKKSNQHEALVSALQKAEDQRLEAILRAKELERRASQAEEKLRSMEVNKENIASSPKAATTSTVPSAVGQHMRGISPSRKPAAPKQQPVVQKKYWKDFLTEWDRQANMHNP